MAAFAIDTGDGVALAEAPLVPRPQSTGIDEGQSIDLETHGDRTERMHRKIISSIEVCEDLEILADFMKGESLLLDAFWMARPDYWELINEAYEMQKAILTHAKQPEVSRTW